MKIKAITYGNDPEPLKVGQNFYGKKIVSITENHVFKSDAFNVCFDDGHHITVFGVVLVFSEPIPNAPDETLNAYRGNLEKVGEQPAHPMTMMTVAEHTGLGFELAPGRPIFQKDGPGSWQYRGTFTRVNPKTKAIIVETPNSYIDFLPKNVFVEVETGVLIKALNKLKTEPPPA